MRFMRLGLLAAALAVAGGVALDTSPASAQWRGRGGGWRGPGIIGGLAAGALIGGALAARPYGYYAAPAYVYDDPYGYGYGPGYAPAGPSVYAASPGYGGGGDATAYCLQRFKSFDPRSGTYLGYDGLRHPCPE